MFGELQLKYHIGLHNTVKTFNTMGLKSITYKKNGLYYVFIPLVNSFREQCVCFRESDNWSMVGLNKFYLKKWTARSFFLTCMIKRGFLKMSGLLEHAIFINFKNHNMCIEWDVLVKTSDQFKVWKQNKECKSDVCLTVHRNSV